MSSHSRLWSELVLLLRGLKDLNAHVLETSGVRCEAASAHALGYLHALGPVRLTELAGSLGLDPSSVSRTVSSLERAGWVAREEDPADRRASRLRLTDEGTGVVRAVNRARVEALVRLTPGWDAEELDGLAGLLARLNADLDANRALLDVDLEHA